MLYLENRNVSFNNAVHFNTLDILLNHANKEFLSN
jgi:hypothetical protein